VIAGKGKRSAQQRALSQHSRETSDPLFNQTVEKALIIVEAFGGDRRALNIEEIAASTGMTRSSAQRCVHTLERLGYLERDARIRRWMLRPRTLRVARAYLAGNPLIEQATTHLIDLNQETGESVSLSQPDDTDMIFVARFPSHKRFVIHMPIGSRLPMYCSASGRAYLSALPIEEVQEVLRRSNLKAFTHFTCTGTAKILALVKAAREAGYAWNDQECHRDDVSIAVPVTGEDGRPVAAIALSSTTSRYTLNELRAKWSLLLRDTARAASSGTAGRLRT